MKQQLSKKKIALVCGALITLTTSSPALVFAQNAQSTVIVSGSRFEENLNEVPANVQVITREEISESSSTNIPDILSQIGGLNIRNTNGGQLNLGASIDMGGYGVTSNSTTLVLVDGQKINPIDSSSVSWESIPLDSINRIEILHGGASVQYGNGAVGGVINIITNGGKKNLNQASTTYGSFNTLINNAIFRNTIDQTTVQLSANTSNSNGWRQNSAANAYAFDAKVTQALGGKDSVYADVFYSYSNQQNPGGVVGQVGQGDAQAAKFNNIGSGTSANNTGIRAGLAKELGSTFNLEVDGFYSNKTTFFNQPYYSTQAAGIGDPDNFQYQYISPSFTKFQGWQGNFTPRIKGDFGSFGSGILGYEFNKASQSSSNSFSSVMNQTAANVYGPGSHNGSVAALPLQAGANASLYNQSVYFIQKLPITHGIELNGGYRYQTQSATANGTDIWSGAANDSQTYSTQAAGIGDPDNFQYQYISPSFTKFQGWQGNFTPRIKGDFGSFGSGILGYEFNKASQSSSNSFSSVMNQTAANVYGPGSHNGSVAALPLQAGANASLYNQSVYFIQKLPITHGIELNGGYRYQTQSATANGTDIWSGAANDSQTYSANAGDVALNFKYLEGQRIYIKWNQSYRFPNIDEFWGWSKNGGGATFGGILRPQTAQTYELGGNWQVFKSNLTASIFTSVSQNEIMYNPSTFINSNSPYNINRNGIIFNGLTALTPKLSLGAGGTVQHAFYASGPYQNQAIPQVPNVLLNARATYSFTSNWSVGGVVNYVGSQHYDASPIYYNSLAAMPSYTVADIYANYKYGNWETRLTIKNVGNSQYSTYGGYGFVTGPNSNNANNYFYYPNDPRSVFVSAKYSFN